MGVLGDSLSHHHGKKFTSVYILITSPILILLSYREISIVVLMPILITLVLFGSLGSLIPHMTFAMVKLIPPKSPWALSTIRLPSTATAISSEQTPSIGKEVFSVALPGLAACIVEPLLTIIDSIFIGQFFTTQDAAATSFAALSMNNAIFNIIVASTAPLCSSTTSLVAKASGESQLKGEEPDIEKKKRIGISDDKKIILFNGLLLSSVVGILLSVLLQVFGLQIIDKAFQPEAIVLSHAFAYLRIRAISLPFVLNNFVIFGYSLATQNVLAPILSIMTAFIANIIGDYVFIHKFGWGLWGAAAATAGSCVLGSTMALLSIFSTENYFKSFFQNIKDGIRGDVLKRFFSTSILLLIGTVANTVTYSSGAKVASATVPMSLVTAASGAQTMSAASHQIALQVWWLLSFFSSPLSLAAQSLIPRDMAADRLPRARSTVKLLAWLALVVALGCTAVNFIIPKFFLGAFTSSAPMHRMVQGVVAQMCLSQFFICLATMLDGVYIGTGHLKDYAAASVLSTLVAWGAYGESMRAGRGLIGAWNGLLVFSIIRFAYFGANFPRIWRSMSRQRSLPSEKS